MPSPISSDDSFVDLSRLNISSPSDPTSNQSSGGVPLPHSNASTSFESTTSKPFVEEFDDGAKQQGWGNWKNPNRPTGKRYRKEFTKACEDEFNRFFHHNPSKLEAWQTICKNLGITPAASINQCKKLLANVYVNIFDYVDCVRAERPIHPVFHSKAKFRAYTMDNRIFPKNAAKSNPFLKVLLKVI